MGLFAYKAIDVEGVLVKGTIEAGTVDEAHDDLSTKGLSVLSLTGSTGLFAGFQFDHLDAVAMGNEDSLR